MLALGGGLLLLVGGTLAVLGLCTEAFPKLGEAIGLSTIVVGIATLITARYAQRRSHRRIRLR